MLQLYLVVKQEGQENFDGLVWATCRSDAVSLWQQADWVIDAFSEDEGHPDRVFLVPAVPPLDVILRGSHCLKWWTDELNVV